MLQQKLSNCFQAVNFSFYDERTNETMKVERFPYTAFHLASPEFAAHMKSFWLTR